MNEHLDCHNLVPNQTPDAQQLSRLPLKNIVVASISEFEALMGSVGAGEIELRTFLREVSKSNDDPAKSVMFLEQMLEHHVKQVRLPQALKEAREEAEATWMFGMFFVTQAALLGHLLWPAVKGLRQEIADRDAANSKPRLHLERRISRPR